MGLDFVELVLAVEEAFDFEIPDEKAEYLTTPGKMKEFVLQRLQITASAICLSQRAFYQLRRALRTSDTKREWRIRPDTEWQDIAPAKSSRRDWWHQLGVEAGLQLPELVRPTWMVRCGLYGSLSVAIISLLATFSANLLAVSISAVFLWLGILMILSLTSMPFRTELPEDCKTIGDAARFATHRAPRMLKHPGEDWNRADVSKIVDQIIIDQLGVQDFHDDSNFFRDLKVG